MMELMILEKRKATYNLESFKQSDFAITKTALMTAGELGMDSADIRQVVSTMYNGPLVKTTDLNFKSVKQCG